MGAADPGWVRLVFCFLERIRQKEPATEGFSLPRPLATFSPFGGEREEHRFSIAAVMSATTPLVPKKSVRMRPILSGDVL